MPARRVMAWAVLAASLVPAGSIVPAPPPAATPAPQPGPATDRREVRFTITEEALLDALRAAPPYPFSAGNQLLKIDLTLSEPRELRLLNSSATLKVRLRGSGVPVDQVLQPVFTLRYEETRRKFFVVVSSLPVQLPGFGTIDLKDSFPRFEIPEILEDLWKFGDRPVAVNLDIRRIALLDHALEIGAVVNFAAASPGGTHGTR